MGEWLSSGTTAPLPLTGCDAKPRRWRRRSRHPHCRTPRRPAPPGRPLRTPASGRTLLPQPVVLQALPGIPSCRGKLRDRRSRSVRHPRLARAAMLSRLGALVLQRPSEYKAVAQDVHRLPRQGRCARPTNETGKTPSRQEEGRGRTTDNLLGKRLGSHRNSPPRHDAGVPLERGPRLLQGFVQARCREHQDLTTRRRPDEHASRMTGPLSGRPAPAAVQERGESECGVVSVPASPMVMPAADKFRPALRFMVYSCQVGTS